MHVQCTRDTVQTLSGAKLTHISILFGKKFWQVLKQSRLKICKEQQPPIMDYLKIEFPNLVQQSSNDSFSFALVSQLPCSALFQLDPSCFSSAAAAMSSYQHQCQVNWTFFVPSPHLGAQQAVKIILFMMISFLMLHRVGVIFKRTFRTEMKSKSCCHELGSDARGVYISHE